MKKTVFKHLSNQHGVTLIELLAVIVILGILAAVAVPAVLNNIQTANTNADLAAVKIIEDATQRYLIENTDQIPATGTTNITIATLVTNGYLDSAPNEPSTGDAYTSVTIDSNGKVTAVNTN